MLHRRSFLRGLLAMPAIVSSASLMPISEKWMMPTGEAWVLDEAVHFSGFYSAIPMLNLPRYAWVSDGFS